MKTIIPTILILLFAGTTGFAQQLVYTPVNPNFGGNPLNYSGLLASQMRKINLMTIKTRQTAVC